MTLARTANTRTTAEECLANDALSAALAALDGAPPDGGDVLRAKWWRARRLPLLTIRLYMAIYETPEDVRKLIHKVAPEIDIGLHAPEFSSSRDVAFNEDRSEATIDGVRYVRYQPRYYRDAKPTAHDMAEADAEVMVDKHAGFSDAPKHRYHLKYFTASEHALRDVVFPSLGPALDALFTLSRLRHAKELEGPRGCLIGRGDPPSFRYAYNNGDVAMLKPCDR